MLRAALKRRGKYGSRAGVSTPIHLCCCDFRAAEGIRTLDPKLGKLVLYQLSYHRVLRGPH